ncbi:MAG: hypothetical protein ACRELC_06930, partial [Gemmatimonadota bacterium]
STAALAAYCASDDATNYTKEWFRLASLIERGLEDGLEDGPLGAPSEGAMVLTQLAKMSSADHAMIFQPCGLVASGAPACQPWEDFDDGAEPQFLEALTPGNLWAVFSPEAGTLGVNLPSATYDVCVGPSAPCEDLEDPSADEDVWGFGPRGGDDWGDLLSSDWGLAYGFDPAKAPSNGETPLGSNASYFFSTIPHFEQLPTDVQLNVTFCTLNDEQVPAGDLAVIMHESAATERGTIGAWCIAGGPGHAAGPSGGVLDRLAWLARALMDPTPRPLWAFVRDGSPAGGVGGLGSHLFGIQTPELAILEILGPVQDSDGPLLGGDGEALRVLARTASSSPAAATGIEKAVIQISIANNNGTIPSGKAMDAIDPDDGDVVCSNTAAAAVPSWYTPGALSLPSANICFARTEADEVAGAGIATFPVTITKNGSFRLTASEASFSTSQFLFDPVEFGPFNITPGQGD